MVHWYSKMNPSLKKKWYVWWNLFQKPQQQTPNTHIYSEFWIKKAHKKLDEDQIFNDSPLVKCVLLCFLESKPWITSLQVTSIFCNCNFWCVYKFKMKIASWKVLHTWQRRQQLEQPDAILAITMIFLWKK